MRTLIFRRNNILVGFILGTILSLTLGFVTGLAVFGQISLMVAIPMMVILLCFIVLAYRINRFAGTRIWPVSYLMKPKKVPNTIVNVCVMDMCAFLISCMMVTTYYVRGVNIVFYALIVLFICLFICGIICTLREAMPSKSSQQTITSIEDLLQKVVKTTNENSIDNILEMTRIELVKLLSN